MIAIMRGCKQFRYELIQQFEIIGGETRSAVNTTGLNVSRLKEERPT